jgi:hypothetical protein
MGLYIFELMVLKDKLLGEMHIVLVILPLIVHHVICLGDELYDIEKVLLLI